MRLTLLTILTMLAFAANSVLNRMALADGLIGPASFAMIRVVSGAGILALLVWWQDRKLAVLGETSVFSVLGLAVYILGFAFAYQSLDAGIGALILFGVVQITMFTGAVLSKETPRRNQWIGAAVAFSGLAYLLAPSTASPDLAGVGLMAAAGVGWGYYSLYGRGVTRPLQATAGNFLLNVPIVILVWLWFLNAETMQPTGVVLAILSGAGTSGLGYALWYLVLPKLEAAQAAIAQLSVPVLALAGGMIFLGEALSLEFTIAGILILGGIGLSLRR